MLDGRIIGGLRVLKDVLEGDHGPNLFGCDGTIGRVVAIFAQLLLVPAVS